MNTPDDHEQRLERARASLEGLSLGDAFGERFFVNPDIVEGLINARAVPRGPWQFTDDTEMAISVVDVLAARRGIDRELLADYFARRYLKDPARGYGPGAHRILTAIAQGIPWQEAAGNEFGGQGSFGNGGAMRSAPIGAYFADDLEQVALHANASAEVTHAHFEGKAGAIFVALAAAYAWRWKNARESVLKSTLLEFVFEHGPRGETHRGVAEAMTVPQDCSPRVAAKILGSGAAVSAMDTVPFSLWCAQRHLSDYEEALWTTVSGLGDRDTTCAIVGGIVAISADKASIPAEWRELREPLW